MDTLVTDLFDTIVHHVTPDLLREQVEYFNYAEKCITWINLEGRLMNSKIKQNPMPAQEEKERPQKYVN